MMSMMIRRTLLPLFAAALLATVAGITATVGPAHGSGPLPAPSVEVVGMCADRVPEPRSILLARNTGVAGAERYEKRVKWGRDATYGSWAARPKPSHNGLWPVAGNRPANPGETYVVQVRAVDGDGKAGAIGEGRYSYPVGNRPEPTQVEVGYTADGVRVTWHGDEDGSGWFSVQHRAGGGKWQSGPWVQSAQLDGDDSPYFAELDGLDGDRVYQFRVTEFTPGCEASRWSGIVTLLPVPEKPTFRTSTGRAGDGHAMAVWITGKDDLAEYHTFTVDDADPVKVKAGAEAPARYRMPVELRETYRVCVTAGNERGESGARCASVTAEITSPLQKMKVRPDRRAGGSLEALITLIPVVNPTFFSDRPYTTHFPPSYDVAIREAGTGSAAWPGPETEVEEQIASGMTPSVPFDRLTGDKKDRLKGDTKYEVAVRSNYYGETTWKKAIGRSSVYAPQGVVVGFEVDDEGNTTDRITVGWEAPQDDGQTGYVANLRKGNGRKVNGARLDGDAVTTTFAA